MLEINVRTKPVFDNKYFKEMEESYMFIDEESSCIMLESAITELGFLTEANITGKLSVSPVNEEVSLGELARQKITERKTEGAWERIAYFFEKVINFLTNSINKFIENAGTLFQDYEEWFQANRDKVDPATMNPTILNELSFTVIPYFNSSSFERLVSPNNIGGISTVDQISDKFADPKSKEVEKADGNANYLYHTYFKPLADIDNENPKNASLLYWRGFEKNPELFATVKISNKNADKAIQASHALTEMIKFCGSYRQAVNAAKGMVDRTKAASKKAKDKLKTLENRLNIQNAGVEKRVDNLGKAQKEAREQAKQQAQQPTVESKPTADAQNNAGAKESYYLFNNSFDTILEGSLINNEDINFDIVEEVNGVSVATKAEPTPEEKVKQSEKQLKNTTDKLKVTKTQTGVQKHIVSACKIHQTIATSRLTVTEEIFRHYVKVMQDITYALQELDEKAKASQANADFNQRKVDQKNARRQEILDNDAFRRERAAKNKGILRRAADGIFGKNLQK